MTQVGNKAVILLSGGLDSATSAAIAASLGFECFALSFCYGQRHDIEIEAAKRVAKFLNIRSHKIIPIAADAFGNSALTDFNIKVPKQRSDEQIASGVPITYVPVRNLVFLSYAAAYSETIGAFDIFIGVNCCDYSGYPDCRPEFIESFTHTLNLASAVSTSGKGSFKVHTPIIKMAKSQIIKTGTELGLDYSITHSCYDPINAKACGRCDSCILRIRGFQEANIPDPTEYAV